MHLQKNFASFAISKDKGKGMLDDQEEETEADKRKGMLHDSPTKYVSIVSKMVLFNISGEILLFNTNQNTFPYKLLVFLAVSR